jgi:hypothetical protein
VIHWLLLTKIIVDGLPTAGVMVTRQESSIPAAVCEGHVHWHGMPCKGCLTSIPDYDTWDSRTWKRCRGCAETAAIITRALKRRKGGQGIPT